MTEAQNESEPGVVESEAIAAAEAYEALHVPALFAEWCGPVLDAADVTDGSSVLDVACGTGVLARTASGRTGVQGSVVGLDVSPGMLAVAERLGPAIQWRQGAAENLPFEDDTFDAVVSQFGLMFFEDRSRAIAEMIRVLAPGGRLAVAVWDALDRQPAYSLEVDLLQRIGGDAAADALRAPFVLGDPDELASLFRDAGAPPVEVRTRVGEAHFPSIRVMVEADLRGWLPVMGVFLSEERIGRILQEAEEVLGEFVQSDGSVAFDSLAHIVSTAG